MATLKPLILVTACVALVIAAIAYAKPNAPRKGALVRTHVVVLRVHDKVDGKRAEWWAARARQNGALWRSLRLRVREARSRLSERATAS